jgi:predicted metal-binding protein
MPNCRQCEVHFPNYILIDGKKRNVSSRKFCLNCSPFGAHNTRQDISKPKKPRLYLRNFVCKSCNNERQETSRNNECGTCRAKKRRRNHKLKASALFGSKCLYCRYNKCLDALDFHHINEETKTFSLSANWHLSWDKIEKELEKCILICANCHREIHSEGG